MSLMLINFILFFAWFLMIFIVVVPVSVLVSETTCDATKEFLLFFQVQILVNLFVFRKVRILFKVQTSDRKSVSIQGHVVFFAPSRIS